MWNISKIKKEIEEIDDVEERILYIEKNYCYNTFSHEESILFVFKVLGKVREIDIELAYGIEGSEIVKDLLLERKLVMVQEGKTRWIYHRPKKRK